GKPACSSSSWFVLDRPLDTVDEHERVVRSGDIPVHRRRDPGDYACHLCSLFVVCDKDRKAAANSSPFDGAAGSWTVTRSPPAARGLRVRVPSCASAMLLTIARPRPTPTPASSVRIR